MLIPLKALRDRAKITQAGLAKELNVAPSTIGMWEQGRNEPAYEMLKRIADYFDVTTDYLLGRKSQIHLLTETQKNLLGIFDGLNDEGQTALMVMLNSLKVSHTKQKSKPESVVQKNIGGVNNLAVNGNIYGK